MDLFTHLTHRYPSTPNATRLHAPHQLQISHQVAPLPNVELIQNRSPDESMRPDPNRTQARSTPVLTPGYGSGPQQTYNPVGPRGVANSDPAGPLSIYRMDHFPNLADQYIPSSSDKITCTDHRPLDEIFGNMHPSSKWSQTQPSSLHSSQNGTPRGHPRNQINQSVLTYALPIKPQLAQLDGVLQIPLLAVDNQMRGTGLVVDFRCSDWGVGVQVQGIPMSELLHGNVSGLEDPHQRVLDGYGLTHLRFNILWPHYPPFAKVISAFGTDRKPITRAELGYEVSLAFAEMFYQITSQSIFPAQPGPYTISSSSAGSPSQGIQFNQLHLISVRNTSCGEWMAEIRAVSMS